MKRLLRLMRLRPVPGVGQSLAEVALGFVFLLFLLAGVIDIGRLYFTYVALEDSAGEAALFLSIYPGCITNASDASPHTTGECDDPNNAQYRAIHSGGRMVDWESLNAEFSVTCYTTNGTVRECFLEKYDTDPNRHGVERGDTVRVEISYPYRFIAPLIPEIAGAPEIIVRSRASERIVGIH